ncbi:MAG: uracil-DNA glycosylase family protein [Anaerolineae bacterium]|nr:uracil-DNA glycosylase family protein [Anaerolineae bacterium]
MADPTAQARLDALHTELSRCRRCAEAGYFIDSRPVFSGPASAQVIIVGQAPAKVEAGESGIPFGPRRGGQRSLLWEWLEQAGWSEADFRANHYLSAVTKCFPGKSKSGGGDRVPTAKERELCRPWREQEMAIIQPKIVIAIGRVAIEQFLPELKGQPLDRIIGQIFAQESYTVVPLPHPSGVSRWLNKTENRARVDQALERLAELREGMGIR